MYSSHMLASNTQSSNSDDPLYGRMRIYFPSSTARGVLKGDTREATKSKHSNSWRYCWVLADSESLTN